MIEFDDQVLAHLQIVIATKLRRRESFLMSWRNTPDCGDGRSSIWLEPSIPLFFRFDGSRQPTIDHEWIERLAHLASTTAGLTVVDQDGEEATAMVVMPPSAHTHVRHS
ncbi:ATP-dependent DNA ligase [Leifsonia poae]|uniref:DUF7882 family protein n=1 Tax=Leifsonia poae TaxID=110933 RepID=UPI003D6963A5